jgi:cyclopropane fatty-acyl-phospholipid synthase-like methyltransferase
MKTTVATDAEPRVVNCYSFFDKVFPTLGMPDYTEGMYNGDPTTPFDVAQRNQIEYLLDEVECRRGTRLLDIGCGNGELVAAAAERGANVVGITISPEQVQLCRDRGLDVRLLNYRNLGNEWCGQFDAVIANGPIEHFVQARDAAAGLEDSIYRRMFEIVHRLIDAGSHVRKFVNTTIHFVRTPKPADLLASPFQFRWGSDSFHYAMLEKAFGGWYPRMGQLESCASGRFALTKTIDGTIDYHLTSEEWLRRVKSEMRRVRSAPRLAWRSLPVLLKHPRQCFMMLTCMLVSQSWNWQFRASDPPTRLLRQTWRYQPTDASNGHDSPN